MRSPAEAAAYRLLRGSGLPTPRWNCTISIGGVALGRPDAYWHDEAVALEIDSRRWHLGPAEWEQTMRRHARFTAAGIAVVHVSPQRVRDRPHEVVADLGRTLSARRGVGLTLTVTIRA